jgi:hypothetical protein
MQGLAKECREEADGARRWCSRIDEIDSVCVYIWNGNE